MIKWWELQKVVKIYLEEMMQHEENLHESGGMNGTESFKEYAITTTDNTERCVLRLKEYHDSKECTYEIVTKECSLIKIKKTPNTIFSVLIDNEEGLINITDFTMEDISRLGDMITDYVNTIKNYDEKHPKFDMDEDHSVSILEVVFKERDHIEIRFVANNRIFNRNNKLYVGFDATDENGREWNYVFKVTEKRIPFKHSSWNSVTSIPSQEYVYTAEFHGYFRPTEEEILNATFRWVVSDEVIKTANKEARYT